MRSTLFTAALSLATAANGLKILMNNDDGFGSGNLRELYGMLKEDGHDGMFLFSSFQFKIPISLLPFNFTNFS
jgi:5'-nucleotidase